MWKGGETEYLAFVQPHAYREILISHGCSGMDPALLALPLEAGYFCSFPYENALPILRIPHYARAPMWTMYGTELSGL